MCRDELVYLLNPPRCKANKSFFPRKAFKCSWLLSFSEMILPTLFNNDALSASTVSSALAKPSWLFQNPLNNTPIYGIRLKHSPELDKDLWLARHVSGCWADLPEQIKHELADSLSSQESLKRLLKYSMSAEQIDGWGLALCLKAQHSKKVCF